MECCNTNYCKRYKDEDQEKVKEVCVSSFEEVIQNLSCNIRYELTENKHCFFGALTRATLTAATTWGSGKIIELLQDALPEWAMK